MENQEEHRAPRDLALREQITRMNETFSNMAMNTDLPTLPFNFGIRFRNGVTEINFRIRNTLLKVLAISAVGWILLNAVAAWNHTPDHSKVPSQTYDYVTSWPPAAFKSSPIDIWDVHLAEKNVRTAEKAWKMFECDHPQKLISKKDFEYCKSLQHSIPELRQEVQNKKQELAQFKVQQKEAAARKSGDGRLPHAAAELRETFEHGKKELKQAKTHAKKTVASSFSSLEKKVEAEKESITTLKGLLLTAGALAFVYVLPNIWNL